jgi:transcriptional regulator with XRE-family HTH domain
MAKKTKKVAKETEKPRLNTVKETLIKHDKSQYWLAKTTGITPVSIRDYVKGNTEPSLVNLKRIADALNVPGKDLINF